MRSHRVLLLVVMACYSLTVTAAPPHQHEHESSTESLGKVHFAVSCSPAAQRTFDRAVALLHSFGYDEAEKAFNEAAGADPRCGMAWWGAAMSNYHPLWAPPTATEMVRGRAAAEKATLIGAKSDREKAYIAAIAGFYADSATVDHHTRAVAYTKAMEDLHQRFPDDHEAAIFYALALISTAPPTDKTYAGQKKAVAILESILPLEPEHPGVAHYIIHSYDNPQLAGLALPAARTYAKIAPSSPHALHMPSHIFVRLGLWDETIASNLASAHAANEHAMKVHPGTASFDALHADDYLTYAWLQKGEDGKVDALMKELADIKGIEVDNFAAYYALAAIPARAALERRRWNDAAALTVAPPGAGWEHYPYAEAVTHFAAAIGAARSGDLPRARGEIDRLGVIHQALVDQKNDYWAGQVDIERWGASAWLARAEGKNDEAMRLMKQAADAEDATEKHPVTPGAVLPAREMLGDLLSELGEPREALAAYESVLTRAPRRFNALSGAARAAQQSGDREKALRYYRELGSLIAR
jgi:tetratricopeptide (TPR) repeat protein